MTIRDSHTEDALAEAGLMRLSEARLLLDLSDKPYRELLELGLLVKQSIPNPTGGKPVTCVSRAQVEHLLNERDREPLPLGEVWGLLTPSQRTKFIEAYRAGRRQYVRSGQAAQMRPLRQHGLIDDANRLTARGEKLGVWLRQQVVAAKQAGLTASGRGTG